MDFSKYGVKHATSCESCEYYQYDDYIDGYSCTLNLDEDEAQRLMYGKNDCQYYKFYDEYKSVQKQI